MGTLLTITLIAIIVLLVLGIGVGGTFDAIKKGWDKLPAQNITKNFQEAAEKSAIEIAQEVEP